MEAKRDETEKTLPPRAAERSVEAQILRILLQRGEFEHVLAGALSVLSKRAGFEWAAIVEAAPGAPPRLAHVWEAVPGGSFAQSPDGRGLEIPGYESAGSFREETLPLVWGGELSHALASKGLVRVLCAPVHPGRSSAPTLFFARRTDAPFTRTARDLIESIAGPVGTRYDFAGRQSEIERRVEERMRELAVLYDLSRSAGTTLRYEDLLGLLVRSIHALLDNDIATILIDLAGRRSLSVHLARPASAECQAEAAAAARKAFAGFAGREAHVCEVCVCPMDEFERGAAMVQGRLGSQRAAPLVRRGAIVGAICAFSRQEGAFADSRVRLFHALANQASLTLDRLSTLQEAEEDRVQSIIDSMPNGILTTDLQFRVLFTNPAARRCLETLTGSASPAALGRLGDLRLSEVARPILEGERSSVSSEISLDEPRRVYSLGLSPLAGTAGGPAGLVFVISDVTEARMMQEQLQQSEKLSALGEMISGVAHELNNPLASVMGYAQILQRANAGGEIKRKLDVIYSESQRCQRIVQNLLSFARRHQPEKTLIDLNSALTSILSLLSYQLKVEGIEIRSSLDPEIPPILGDFHQLQQVFLNIVNNAHHAMRGSTTDRVLEVKSIPAGDSVRVEIHDSGPGISPENLKRIFDPFFTTKAVGHGTGLGLSLAYSAVKDHAGSIYARSQLGKGTTFIVELPVSTGRVADDSRAIPSSLAFPSRRGTILVVEDEEALSGLLVEALVAAGHEVDSAGDGLEALSRIRERRYDLIISDVKMPRMDGPALYAEVQRLHPGLARRMIFSTGDVASRETQAFLAEMGSAIFTKPFDLEEVQREVERLLCDARR